MRHRALLLVILILLVGIGWFAYSYANRRASLANNAVPSPPQQGSITFAGPTPLDSFHQEEGNVLVRTVFETDTPSNARVEIRDYMFPPNAKSKLGAPPGAAVLEVYSGEGTLSLGEDERGVVYFPSMREMLPSCAIGVSHCTAVQNAASPRSHSTRTVVP